MVYFHRLCGITDTKADFKFSFKDPVKFSAGENEEIMRPVVDMRKIHSSNFSGDKEARSKRDIWNYIVGIKESHARTGVTVPVIFIVRFYKRIELFIELTQF